LENGLQIKGKGGLGIINLEEQNRALPLKNLDKFYNKKDIPWVNMIWKNTIRMTDYQDTLGKALFGGGITSKFCISSRRWLYQN
jgi:hypothetical protein